MSKTQKKRWFDVIRITVCVLALWLVARGVTISDSITLTSGDTVFGQVLDTGDPVIVRLTTGEQRSIPLKDIALDEDGSIHIAYGLRTSLGESQLLLLGLALLIYFPVTFLLALRLKWLLNVQQICLTYWECIKLSFAGNFLNFATPFGSNAGDVFKAYFVTTHTTRKTEAASTIAFDRVIGLGTLILCVTVITSFTPSDTPIALLRPYIFTIAGACGLGTLAYLSPFLRDRLNLGRWLSRLPMYEQLRRVDQAAKTLAGHLPTLFGALLVTICLQVLSVSAYFTVAKAVGLTAHLDHLLEYFAYFYTGSVIQALPGPPQGLGTVELAFRYFFSTFGSASQIVCMAFLIRIVVLTCALPGLLVTITGSYKPEDVSGDPLPSTAETTTHFEPLAVVADRDLATS